MTNATELATITERLEGQRRDLERLEAGQKWFWRILIGLAAVQGIDFTSFLA